MVHHPGIVRIIDHGVAGNNPWYAMDLITGRTLSDHLVQLRGEASSDVRLATAMSDYLEAERKLPSPTSLLIKDAPPRFSLRDCLGTVRAICRTLSFLHGRGLVHRDLKPANILIRDGAPVLVDFGLVIQFSGAAGREVLELADVAGTFAYMAPEQRFGRFVDARADLYSLGCVLYEWLTGAAPFGPSGI